MDHYRELIAESGEFVAAGISASRQSLEERMRDASEAHDFESAARIKARLDRTEAMMHRNFRYVADIEDFRFVAACPSPRTAWRRLFVIVGGCVTPWCDIHDEADAQQCEEAVRSACEVAADAPISLDEKSVEAFGMIATHLFRPVAKVDGAFHRASPDVDAVQFLRAARRSGASGSDSGDQVIKPAAFDQ